MKISDIYKHKKSNTLIQINSFATNVKTGNNMIIVYNNITPNEYRYCPSFNGYGTGEEIEEEYELFIPMEELQKYNSWEEIFEKLKEGE